MVSICSIFKCGSDGPRAAARKSCHDIRLFLEHIAAFRTIIRSPGHAGRQGPLWRLYRTGAGRPAGSYSITKKAKGAARKKKKAADPEPTKASVNFLDAFVVKKAAAAAELAAAQSVR